MSLMTSSIHAETLILFNYDWDQIAHTKLAARWPHISAGFDLFSFPSNAQLAWFDMDRFVTCWATKAKRLGLKAVTSNHEQFGALAAALLAERMGWPGTPVRAVLACQHKLFARDVLARVAPDANPPYARLDAQYGGPVPTDLSYPLFVKPVKAAFSVLARTVHSQAELHRHTRFGAWELWVIRHLVEPFERIMRQHLPGGRHGAQPDGRSARQRPAVLPGRLCASGQHDGAGLCRCGHVPADRGLHALRLPQPPARPISRPGRPTWRGASWRRWASPTACSTWSSSTIRVTDALTVIEFNPAPGSQFSDLYRRVDGIDLHEIALALAHGQDPANLPRLVPTAGAASSFVYREFDPASPTVAVPDAQRQRAFHEAWPGRTAAEFPKSRGSTARDFKWLGSYRYGIMHLGGQDGRPAPAAAKPPAALLGWVAPYEDLHVRRTSLTGGNHLR
jgi:hypothetical protein